MSCAALIRAFRTVTNGSYPTDSTPLTSSTALPPCPSDPRLNCDYIRRNPGNGFESHLDGSCRRSESMCGSVIPLKCPAHSMFEEFSKTRGAAAREVR